MMINEAMKVRSVTRRVGCRRRLPTAVKSKREAVNTPQPSWESTMSGPCWSWSDRGFLLPPSGRFRYDG